MLYLLAEWMEFEGLFNLVRYQTFRAGATLMTALVIGLIIGPRLIDMLRVRQGKGQPIREDGPQTHLAKVGTPTMGGLMILISLTLSLMIWMDLSSPFVWACLAVTGGFGLIGFMDDYDKVSKGSHKGVSGKIRLLLEFIVAGIASYIIVSQINTWLYVPFVSDRAIPLGWGYYFFAAFVIVGAGNAVNLTDGLDGLAIMPVMIAAGALGVIAYAVGRVDFTEYLDVHYVPGTGEILVFTAGIFGGGLGFLWYNAPPAAVFMGDTGSLALGGALGAIAVATKHEIVMAIIGGLFVIEALSVIIQVGWFKLTGKRVFLMAPIHHHYEKKGWAEPQIVIRFWIISLILAMIGLATLKVR